MELLLVKIRKFRKKPNCSLEQKPPRRSGELTAEGGSAQLSRFDYFCADEPSGNFCDSKFVLFRKKPELFVGADPADERKLNAFRQHSS